MSSKYDSFSKEELIKIINKQAKDLKTKKYGLVWDSEKYPEQVVLDCENNLPILQRINDKTIVTDNSEQNILIEGDNYHALTCLNYTHKGKIDMIYIDPPYNTGNKDFKYNDRYIDKEDGYKHSKWLNFMEKRLKLAKNLLSPNGVIFISIDDNEVSQLKLIADDIFGNEMFLSEFVIQSNPRGSQASNYFAVEHEYLLCYSVTKNPKITFGIEKDENDISEYPYIDENNKRFRHLGLRQRGGEWRRSQRPNMFYPIYINPNNGKVSLKLTDDYFVTSLPLRPSGEEGRWTWGTDKFEKEKHKLIGKKVNRKGENDFWDVFRIDYLESEDGEFKESKIKTIWIEKDINYQNGGDEVKSILGNDKFDYPKPLALIKKIVLMSTSKDAIILDFFAGSGTTGHAVMELNNEDEGNRRFILCTNNEVGYKEEQNFKNINRITEDELQELKKVKNKQWVAFCEDNGICSTVTYPRIHNVIKGYEFQGKNKQTVFEKKLTVTQLTKKAQMLSEEINLKIEEHKESFDKIDSKLEGNTFKIYGIKNINGFKEGLGGNLQYFKTDLIPVEKIDRIDDKQRHELTEKAGQMIAIKENTFEQVECNEWYQIFANKNKNRCAAIYFREDMEKFEELVEKSKVMETVLYIFSYGRIDKKLFKYLGNNIRIEDIPEPIIEIYKEINLTIKEAK